MPSFLITDARVFDGESVIYNSGYVLVVEDRIKSVSATRPAAIPQGCAVVDGSGCTVLPGFIDAHVHAYHDVDFLEKAMLYGVTTVIDMHNEPHWFRDLKAIATERNDVSDIKSVCYAATIKNGWPAAIVTLSSSDPNVRGMDTFDELLGRIMDGAKYAELSRSRTGFPTGPI
jgi:hypothetical protein